MNSLPRFLALALFVALAALVAILAAPAWRGTADPARATPAAGHAPAENLPVRSKRLTALSQRLALGLAVGSAALALLLAVSLAMRPSRPGNTTAPFAAARQEMGTLARLAESSVAQSAELRRERDVRQRAEADAQLQQRLLTQSLEEKIRLGRDLHDGIIQSLYATGLTVESVRALVRTDPAEAERRLDQMRALLNATIRDVRAYITGLTPDNVRHASFGQGVRTLVDELRGGRDVRFEIVIDDAAASQLNAEQSLEALQIAREAVSNALRHGGASVVTVRVHQSDREVCLLVQDNGAGFDPARRREGGRGLGNMQARAGRLGATLRITSRPGEGSRVVATLPILSPIA